MSLSYSKIVNVLKFVMISMPFGVFAPLLGRISFILFLLSSVITAHNPRRKWLWVLIGLQLVINIIPCILQFTQCEPASALWDPLSLIQKCQGAVVVQKFGYFQGGAQPKSILQIVADQRSVQRIDRPDSDGYRPRRDPLSQNPPLE